MSDNRVFHALANADRRHILDLLLERDGRTASELEHYLPISRFGVRKHLMVLRAAGLITTRTHGRRTTHHLSSAPIELIRAHWLGKYVGT
ncbi:ArsR/SmtB family transcription factor [Dactylosporangium sp. CS-033363]|uniref:ArsR/SmtB family transcription factor n=1 Tax=Dactylosporangium sp. CS-033363 TaxID=3239935 RepID=UPI003D8E686F